MVAPVVRRIPQVMTVKPTSRDRQIVEAQAGQTHVTRAGEKARRCAVARGPRAQGAVHGGRLRGVLDRSARQEAAPAAQRMLRVAMIDGDALDARRAPRRHAVEQAHRAAMRDQRGDPGVVERLRAHGIAAPARDASRAITVPTRSTFANGVPLPIGSLATAKPSSRRRCCHCASVRPA